MRTIYYGPRNRYTRHHIPIYDMEFEVAVCHDIKRFRNSKRLVTWLGDGYDNSEDYCGVFCSQRRKTALLMARDEISHRLIAHEVLHAAHYMMEYNDVKFGPTACHETAALVAEHLTGLVYQDLKRWKCLPRS